MKTEAKLIIPNTAKSPGDAARALQVTCRDCAAAFGGYTVTQGDGGWMDPAGVLITEPVSILTVACENTIAAMDILDTIADNVGHWARQDCIYIVYPNGRVYIRDTAHLWNDEGKIKRSDVAGISETLARRPHRATWGDTEGRHDEAIYS
jgi:hypothetical protein